MFACIFLRLRHVDLHQTLRPLPEREVLRLQTDVFWFCPSQERVRIVMAVHVWLEHGAAERCSTCRPSVSLALKNTANRISVRPTGAAADRCSSGEVWICLRLSPFLFLDLYQSWGHHANHDGREAAEGNAHSAEPDRRATGFRSEPHPDFTHHYPGILFVPLLSTLNLFSL